MLYRALSFGWYWLALATMLSQITSPAAIASALPRLKCLMYLTGQHPEPPLIEQLGRVTHVALAFMKSDLFNDDARTTWPLFTDISTVRRQFPPETRVMIAIGGWGDTDGFSAAARDQETRMRFARNVGKMVAATGADGVDIDWEYPGGNGEDYKRVPNSEKAWEVEAYPLLLAELRSALGPKALLSAATPGLQRDMMAFTKDTIPSIMSNVDFLNVMAYDLMGRRDSVTKHHTGVSDSLEAIDAYISRGAVPKQLNLGLAFYTKYVRTEHDDCANSRTAIGCRTLLLEDPETGEDLGRTGGFAWHDRVPDDVAASFARAEQSGVYDEIRGGWYYWDAKEDIWWTYDTVDAILRKFPLIVEERELGGVFAWGLGEDGPEFAHLEAVFDGIDKITTRRGLARDEL